MTGDSLAWKLKTEEYIKESNLPSYTIIRPGRLKGKKIISKGNFTPSKEEYVIM